MQEFVLHRDNYRCAVTGIVDSKSAATGKTELQHGEHFAAVDNAHILPYSLIPASKEEPAIDRSSTIWQVINAFSGISLDDLNGNNINRPENGITLEHSMHQFFGSLSICFEPTIQPDIDTVLRWAPALFLPLPGTVSFVTRNLIPVPDPRYLALHAACAKVVHASGMAKFLSDVIEDLEVTKVLSSDGSSAHLLHHALATVAVQ
ncbi:hypothetical protein M407DRAFT_124227 [Tulasnella calospora MUT 4182]|uniref:HNH nuclease domain-containing protein n=1 Tax=Tulasnella calospora MUT 4182 TaxID=1051891 RepID=A0A0C3QI92_9AGAM|nr:hypothetical protein M407DRAFT_124227 [Tulasnella calospora MUT 4182]